MRALVEERHIKFDTLVAVNDELAYGAMVYLRERGMRLPQDVAITGFDNSQFGRMCTPPLTTVPNRIHERGSQAVDMLLAMINGEKMSDVVMLPTYVKVRQSCGCRDPYIVQINRPPAERFPILSGPDVKEQRDKLYATIIAELQHTGIQENSPHWPAVMLKALETSLDNCSEEPFLTETQKLLLLANASGSELREWHAALSELRRWIIPFEQDQPERLERADRLLHQARVMIGETAARAQASQEWLRGRQLNNLLQLRQSISAAETLDDLMDILAHDLPQLGIAYCCLALYLDGTHPSDGGARLVLAIQNNLRMPEQEGEVYAPSVKLVPPAWFNMPGVFNLVIHPLNIGVEQLGFLVVDANIYESSSHEVLREQISTALKNVLLIEQNKQLYLQARESQLLAEEANSLKSRFLSMVSHELLTPIVLLVGLSEMILREGVEVKRSGRDDSRPPLPEFYRQDLTRIHASAQQLGSLVRDVLDLARSQLDQLTLIKKPIYLADVLKPIELVSEQLAYSKGLEWQVSIPDDLPRVMGDASRLQQVVMNLVSNAVKFTAQGFVRLSVGENEGIITVAVIDTGLSVPLPEQKVIFDEFRQSERTVARGFGGLGIGLAICRQIVEMHGGLIGVQSSGEENSGSTFYFTLPALPDIPEQIQDTSQLVLILTEQAKDDLLQQYLEQQGFEAQILDIIQNPDWMDRISSSQSGKILNEKPAVLVLDLPAARRSWEIMDALKKQPATQDIPIILYSLLQEQDGGSMLSLDYLAKPVAAANLSQALQRYGLLSNQGWLDSDQRTVLIVDDDPEILNLHTRLLEEHIPSCQIQRASNGREALERMQTNQPALVLLDLAMPELDGMAVLKAMQEDKRLRGIPVIVMTAQQLSQDEMARLNQGVVAVLSKGVFTIEETLAQIEQALAHTKRLGSDAQRLVRKVMAYIHEHYDQTVNRHELANNAGVSERHLNRCFLQETGMTPLTYLNRYRIQRARELLEQGQLSITEIMGRVGFSESSHFTRVFRREVGIIPSAYKRGDRP